MDEKAISKDADYKLDEQVGFLLRRANQRHLTIFGQHIPDLTSTQFAALAKLCELGPRSQNALGRATSMDGATIKGVVDRLRAKDLVEAHPDKDDQRRLTLSATKTGQALFAARLEDAKQITAKTLEPLTSDEKTQFLQLLLRLV